MGGTIDQLIINSPWDEPERHWRYERESRTFSLEDGRRPAGYVVATPGSKAFDDPGVFRELPEVNRIRPRVNAWRDAGYPGVTGTTRRLLEHWRDPEVFEERRFFFCQLEAVETLIWLVEAPEGERQGIDVRGDGGPFSRICAKMATGSGKTLVMAMVIAWQVLNRVANAQDPRFSKHVLVVAPGLTVRKRLAVLDPADPGNIFGIPFTFLPHEGGDAVVPPPPPPKSRIEPVPEKREFEITWPNVVRIEHAWAPRLTLDLAAVSVLQIDASETATLAEMAPVVNGKPDVARITEIALDDLARRFRMQTIVFETARDIFDQMAPTWRGAREVLISQVVPLVEIFLASDRLTILPAVFQDDSKRRRILLTLNMSKVVRHLWGAIRDENTTALTPVFDTERPIRRTGDMLPWFTGRPWADTKRSHVNRCVHDSAWEASEAFALDRHADVTAWVKNDHLGFEIVYVFDGGVRKYRPDFVIRLETGTTLVLEVKGQDSPQNEAKRRALEEWTRAVTGHGGFGQWRWAVSRQPGDLADLIAAALIGSP